MGEIKNQKTGSRFTLISRFLVGRSSGCELRIDDQCVSGEHASIYFDGSHWVVRDLMSRNGTTVNGVALGGGDRRDLSQGDVVVFGGADDAWTLVDDAPPEGEGIGQTVQATFDLSVVGLEFLLSQDEETLSLVLDTPVGRLSAHPRAFQQLLLTLARARVKDIEAGVSEAEQGYLYTDDLIPGLYPDAETLNVNIFRARKQFVELGARDARALIERRVASRQLRLGIGKLLIERSAETR